MSDVLPSTFQEGTLMLLEGKKVGNDIFTRQVQDKYYIVEESVDFNSDIVLFSIDSPSLICIYFGRVDIQSVVDFGESPTGNMLINLPDGAFYAAGMESILESSDAQNNPADVRFLPQEPYTLISRESGNVSLNLTNIEIDDRDISMVFQLHFRVYALEETRIQFTPPL